jgi:hypothetical protein
LRSMILLEEDALSIASVLHVRNILRIAHQ